MRRIATNLALPAAALVILACLPVKPAAATTVIGFEDVPIVSGDYENGANLAGGPLLSGGAAFNNYYSYDAQYGAWWEGWACSRVTDTSNPGLGNQYAAVTGGGHGPSAAYGVAYQGFMAGPPTVTFSAPEDVLGGWFTNTAYTYSIITTGDPNHFARQFQQGDWYTLSITGLRPDGTTAGPIVVDLADFSGPTLSILDSWTWVDLSGLGAVTSLKFTLDSSDSDPQLGINTPTYFAMDDLTVAPEPGTLCLAAVGLGLAGLAWLWRRRPSKTRGCSR